MPAACYELTLAVGWVSIGRVSGEGASGEGVVTAAALVAIAVGLVLALRGTSHVELVTVAAAVFVAVRLYTFDPYYAPTLRRMSDGGLVAPGWVAFLVVAALVAAVAERLMRVRLCAGSALVLLACGLTALLEGAGH